MAVIVVGGAYAGFCVAGCIVSLPLAIAFIVCGIVVNTLHASWSSFNLWHIMLIVGGGILSLYILLFACLLICLSGCCCLCAASKEDKRCCDDCYLWSGRAGENKYSIC
jgi:hypothetical protein